MTFPVSGDCNSKTRSYVAYPNMPLPINFIGTSGTHNNTGLPLQLHMSEDGTVITIIATWLDTTIAIRQMDGFLAVTLQVTGEMAFESEGLCTAGCPVYQYIGRWWVGGNEGRESGYTGQQVSVNTASLSGGVLVNN